MTKRTNNGIDPTKCKACAHTGTVHHTDDNGKRYCVACRRTGKGVRMTYSMLVAIVWSVNWQRGAEAVQREDWCGRSARSGGG